MAIWWVLTILSIIAVVLIAAAVCHTLFSTVSAKGLPSDALKSVKLKEGSAVLFSPPAHLRKYVTQYILSEVYGKKSIVCKLTDSAADIRVTAVIYNAFNSAIASVELTSDPHKPELTVSHALPSSAAYAVLSVTDASGATIGCQQADRRVFNIRLMLFAFTLSALTIGEIFLLKLCLSKIFGGVFTESFLIDTNSILITLALSLVCASIISLFGCFFIKIKMTAKGGMRRGK